MKCIAFYEINVNFEIDVANHVFDGEMVKIDLENGGGVDDPLPPRLLRPCIKSDSF